MKTKSKLNFKSILNVLVICCFVLPTVAMVGLAEENNTVKVIHADGSTSGADTSSEYQEYKSNDELANKIYSGDTILGFKMGSGSITDVISLEHCMGVISANPIVFSIICVLFAIGVALGSMGFLWSIIMHAIRIVFASFDANADQAIAKMHQHRKSIVYLSTSVGVCLITMSVGVFILRFLGA